MPITANSSRRFTTMNSNDYRQAQSDSGQEMEFDMKFQGYSILIIVASVLGIILFTAGLVTTAAYGFVKITSPVKGQNVPVGNILISGVSSSNSTNHCTVSVIINGIRPYQQVTSTGMNGPMDYSKWTYIATPEYATVKEGMNKITAKYSCLPEVNFTKFYSVNVTGVAAKVQPILSTPMNYDNGSAFTQSLPSIDQSIVSESKHTEILKSYR
ncbi:MAG: hypothetical protein WAM42_17715 [Candidatus Nitrosopolaris sp.]